VAEKRRCSCTTSETDKQEIYNMPRTYSYTQIILGLKIEPNPEPENYSEVGYLHRGYAVSSDGNGKNCENIINDES
jgi:hypothetical protein